MKFNRRSTSLARFLLALALATATVFSVSPASAEIYPTLITAQQEIESRISNVAKTVDPYAVVSVLLKAKTISSPLPMTRFEVQKTALRASDGSIQVAGMEVDIYLSDMSKAQTLQDMVVKFSKPYRVTPVIRINPLPMEYVEQARKVSQDAATAGNSKKDSDTQKQAPTANPAPGAHESAWLLQVAVALAGLATAALATVGWIYHRRSKDSMRILQSLERAISALSESGGLGKSAMMELAHRPEAPRSIAGPSATSEIDEMRPEARLALLADCYWTQQDEYAAWVWTQMKPAARKDALMGATWMQDYARHLGQVPANASEAWHLDPYYLAPLSLMKLGQDKIHELVLQYPDLFTLLPEIRRRNLPLRVSDRLRLESQAGKSSDAAKAALEHATSSPLRTLTVANEIPIQDAEDEKSLLGMASFDPSVARRLHSLVWFAYLSDQKASEILSKRSAKDLATAWVGPDEVLTRLRSLLPEAKANMLDAYLKRSVPSRKSLVFSGLHGEACAALADLKNVKTNADPEAKADSDDEAA